MTRAPDDITAYPASPPMLPPVPGGSLPPEISRLIQGELGAGETLVWAAQPQWRLHPWPLAVCGLIGLTFGGTYTAYSCYWVAMAVRVSFSPGGGGWPYVLFPILGLPFLMAGLGVLALPYWLYRGRRRVQRRTAYAVTDRRVIILQGRLLAPTAARSYTPERLTSLSCTERADGSGDLVFEQFEQACGSGTTTVRHGFMGVADVRAVEDLIVGTLLAGRTRSG